VGNGSSLNRHGIPQRGPDPKKCIWPRCANAVTNLPLTHLCNQHADLVHNAVEQERRQTGALVAALLGTPPPAPSPPQPTREEVIYYLQVGGHIKIGWTSQFEQRMRSYPPNTTLLAVHPGTRADERKLHKRFAVHRSHGQEWYPLAPVVLNHIKRVLAAHGEPPEVIFGARPVEVPTPRARHRMQAKYGPMTIS
jgi:hypothetical protein